MSFRQHRWAISGRCADCGAMREDEFGGICPGPEQAETPEEKEERLLTMAGVPKHNYTEKTAEWVRKKEALLFGLADPVNSPSHYNTGGIECFDAMSAMLTREEMIGYLRGNSFKYRWRFRHKGGAEDLKKAEWYEKKLLGLIENSA